MRGPPSQGLYVLQTTRRSLVGSRGLGQVAGEWQRGHCSVSPTTEVPGEEQTWTGWARKYLGPPVCWLEPGARAGVPSEGEVSGRKRLARFFGSYKKVRTHSLLKSRKDWKPSVLCGCGAKWELTDAGRSANSPSLREIATLPEATCSQSGPARPPCSQRAARGAPLSEVRESPSSYLSWTAAWRAHRAPPRLLVLQAYSTSRGPGGPSASDWGSDSPAQGYMAGPCGRTDSNADTHTDPGSCPDAQNQREPTRHGVACRRSWMPLNHVSQARVP